MGMSPQRLNLAELLAAIPDVGLDGDFKRQTDTTALADEVSPGRRGPRTGVGARESEQVARR
jgi:hypothetical protein